jgi:glycosyltransferase involved in cell wall biosynthesis
MKLADVFVSPSKFEGFGNVLVEAMACGTSVVSTDCPSGPSEILNRGEYGKLVPVGDALFLSSAILQTLDQPTDSAKLRRRSDFFSVKKSVDNYLKIFF